MRKKLGIFMTAALAAATLTACTQADSGNSSAGTGSSVSSGSGTIEATGNSTESVSYSGSTSGDVLLSGTVSDVSGTVSDVSGTGTETVDGAGFEGGVSVEDDIPGETAAPADEENLSDEQMAALEEEDDASEEGWIGTYLNENSETLTVSAADAATISFSFANAGISGTAALNGNQATYEGDDYHVVVFDFAGTDIKVSVLSEEDYDASSSPINGVYVRQ